MVKKSEDEQSGCRIGPGMDSASLGWGEASDTKAMASTAC